MRLGRMTGWALLASMLGLGSAAAAGHGEGPAHGGRVARRRPAREVPKPTDAVRRPRRVARVVPAAPKPPCLHEPVRFERGFGGEVEAIALTRCDGLPATHAIQELSMLARPMNSPKPDISVARPRGIGQREWLPKVRLVHDGLVTRLQKVTDHFKATKVTIISGYRPSSLGSFHQSARAMDIHLDGVTNEALVAFCRTLPDTGCGYYPNSSFVHVDVRPPDTGHVYWIDASGPGEVARYVSRGPLEKNGTELPRIDFAAPRDEPTHDESLASVDLKSDARLGSTEDPFNP